MLLTLLGLILAVLVQTAIIAYWGGRIARSVAHHDEEISNLRTRWDNGLAGIFQRGVLALEALVAHMRGQQP